MAAFAAPVQGQENVCPPAAFAAPVQEQDLTQQESIQPPSCLSYPPTDMHDEPEISQSVINERKVRHDVGTLSKDESTIIGIQRLAIVNLKRALLRCLPASEDTILIIIEAGFRSGPPRIEHFHAGLKIHVEEHRAQTISLLDAHPRENVPEGKPAVLPEKKVRVKGSDQADEVRRQAEPAEHIP